MCWFTSHFNVLYLLLILLQVEYYTELDKKLTQGYLDPIDLDSFANNITKEDQLYELEDLIHRFRRTPQTISILPSTFHATIRSFLQYKDSKSLLRILQDKHNYGIFPDKFCYNILMDYFIKENNFKDAVKIVKLMMLQEDVGDDISISLAFYSCYKLIQESMPSPYVKKKKQVEEEVDEDDIVSIIITLQHVSDVDGRVCT
ncbi:28S ribosomal protein S27, mitochondrial [Nymphon striatum]|nr:28S ribosomal protein S27, mitochondrial [Nymphon striatum]